MKRQRYDMYRGGPRVVFYDNGIGRPLNYLVWPQGHRNIPYAANKLARARIAELRG